MIDFDKNNWNFLLLYSYIVYENDKDFIQPRSDYIYQDKDDYFFKNN
jgi:hypothetical protein